MQLHKLAGVRDPVPGGASQKNWGPLNVEPAAVPSLLANRSVWRKSRKNKNRKENNIGICCELEKMNKRKSSQCLDEDTRETSSAHSDSPHFRLEVPSGTSSKSTQPTKSKRAKMATPTDVRTAKSACLFSDHWEVDSGFSSETSPPTSGRSSPCFGINHSVLVAMDCEMVGTGPNGQCSELARCSILNYYGTVIYDKYIMPCHPVTNYRTRWSGIKEEHLKQALPYEEARKEILQILKGKVIIGHALHNDFRALHITVPPMMIRDTSSMHLLRQLYGAPKNLISLKRLASKLLNRSIQTGGAGHCSVEDALATLDLYKLVEEQWEKSLQAHIHVFVKEPDPSLEQYMEDQYWPESMTDGDQ